MFYDATAFNQDLSSWNVSHVQDLTYIFYHTEVCLNNPMVCQALQRCWKLQDLTMVTYEFDRNEDARVDHHNNDSTSSVVSSFCQETGKPTTNKTWWLKLFKCFA